MSNSHRCQTNFSACPVWIYTQSNIKNIIFTWVHNIKTHTKNTIHTLHHWLSYLSTLLPLSLFLYILHLCHTMFCPYLEFCYGFLRRFNLSIRFKQFLPEAIFFLNQLFLRLLQIFASLMQLFLHWFKMALDLSQLTFIPEERTWEGGVILRFENTLSRESSHYTLPAPACRVRWGWRARELGARTGLQLYCRILPVRLSCKTHNFYLQS